MQKSSLALTGLFGALLLVGFGGATPAKADVQTIREFNNAVWVSGGPSFFNYKEPSPPPNLPDSERGWIPSVDGGLSVMGFGHSPEFLENAYVALDGGVAFGKAQYNGAFLLVPTTPVQSTTNETVSTFNGRLGRGFVIGKYAMLIPYVEIGFRDWERELSSIQKEHYQNYDSSGGLLLQVSPMNRLVFSAYGSGGTTFGGTMRADGYTYNLADSALYKMGAKLAVGVTSRIELFGALDYDAFRYGHSQVVGDGTYEPNSRTKETKLRVGIGYHFR